MVTTINTHVDTQITRTYKIASTYYTGGANFFILRDKVERGEISKEIFSTAELEIYFNDLYHLFLHTLTTMAHEPEFSEAQEQKIKRLFDELLHTKHMLANPLVDEE